MEIYFKKISFDKSCQRYLVTVVQQLLYKDKNKYYIEETENMSGIEKIRCGEIVFESVISFILFAYSYAILTIGA
jgi:hypothetical protein